MPVKSNDLARVCKLAKDVYSVIWDQDNSSYRANQGFVVLEKSVLLFDTGSSAGEATLLDNLISKASGSMVKYIVNSHGHPNHVLGNAFFSKKYSKRGLDIISSENCASVLIVLSKLKKYKGPGKKLSSAEIVAPNIAYSENGMSLSIGPRKFMFIHPEVGAHTLGDTILAMPESGVMFLGDVLYNSTFPYVGDANIEAWIDFLNDIDYSTYAKFLPGHGRVCGKDEVICFTNYLREIRDRLLSVDTKMGRARLRSCFEIKGTEDWKSRSTIDRNIDALFGESQGRQQPQK
ncbi:MAG TPA: MBL fold metallo-hydrolase [Nitrososphaerales archaeon]|nr:MBL fold metallo-hydrolase [Nitrososphaerales archaeon]